MEMLNELLRAVVPLLVAFNIISVIPLFLTLTEGMEGVARNRLVSQATLTAFFVGAGFLILGRILFDFLDITEDDFRIGGGLVLLVLSISDLLFSVIDKRRSPEQTIGVVPIGVPLIMGPAALTTLLIILSNHGYFYTGLALTVNLIGVWVLLRYANTVVRVIGKSGTKAMGRVMQLILAAIAVKMIRMGIMGVLP